MKVLVSPKQITAAERTLNVGTWAITAGAVLFSVLTVTPLVERVTPDAWDWTAPILPIVVDAAVVIVIRLDSTVSRLGGAGGAWPIVLRWLTGLFTVALNVGDSVWKQDLAGVAVHAVAPLLLIVTAEAGLSYRRAIARALERIEREQQAEAERQRVHQLREREAREQAQTQREQAERAERERQEERAERREREAREHAALLEQQRLDHEARMAREQREAAIALRREEEAKQEREHREQMAREREQRERAEREHQLREQHQRQAREQAAAAALERRERRALNAPDTARKTPPVNTLRLSESDARNLVVNTPGASVRELADKTGWSIGWVCKVRNELAHQANQPLTEDQGEEVPV